MKIEFGKIAPPYSFPVSTAEVKEIVIQCILPEILPRIRKIHFGCNRQTTQEARIIGRSGNFEIRINFCLKEGKTKLLSEKRNWCDLVEACGGKIDKRQREVIWEPAAARTYTGLLIAHEVAHVAYAEKNGQSHFTGKTSASEEAWCDSFAKDVVGRLMPGT
jgi:hypothetical protein